MANALFTSPPYLSRPETSRRANTMNATTEQSTRERAYALWMESGCEEGQADRHWLQAERELAAQLACAATAPANTVKASKAKTIASPKQGTGAAPARSRSRSPKSRAAALPAA